MRLSLHLTFRFGEHPAPDGTGRASLGKIWGFPGEHEVLGALCEPGKAHHKVFGKAE